MDKVHVGEVRVGGPTQRAHETLLGFVSAALSNDAHRGRLDL